MALERTYTIPLRREWTRAPKWKRAKRAVTGARNFLVRHMKSEEVKIGPFLNEELWKHGIQNPPPRVKVNAVKDDNGVVIAELYGKPMPKKKEEEKKKGMKERIAEKVGLKLPEKKDGAKEKAAGEEPVKPMEKSSEEKKAEQEKPEKPSEKAAGSESAK